VANYKGVGIATDDVAVKVMEWCQVSDSKDYGGILIVVVTLENILRKGVIVKEVGGRGGAKSRARTSGVGWSGRWVWSGKRSGVNAIQVETVEVMIIVEKITMGKKDELVGVEL